MPDQCFGAALLITLFLAAAATAALYNRLLAATGLFATVDGNGFEIINGALAFGRLACRLSRVVRANPTYAICEIRITSVLTFSETLGVKLVCIVGVLASIVA